MPALQELLENTAQRMKQMNIDARSNMHTIAVQRQKIEQHKQFREATLQIEEGEARQLGNSISSMETPVGEEEARDEVNEAGSFTEAFSSDEGSIGDDEDVGINHSVLNRKTSPCRN